MIGSGKNSRRAFLSICSKGLFLSIAPGAVLAKPAFGISVTTIINLPNPKTTEEEFYETQKQWVNYEEHNKLKAEFLKKGYMSKISEVKVEDGVYSLTRKFKSRKIFDLWMKRMKKVVDVKTLTKLNMKVRHEIK